MRCVECDAPQASAPLVEVPGGAICHRCITELLGGAVPDRIAAASGQAVYWWWCVCGKQVRRGPYTVDTREVARNWIGSDKQFMREVERIGGYRWGIEGVPSAGVMLCKGCAASAGVPLPAPAPPRYSRELPTPVIDFISRGRRLRRGRRGTAVRVVAVLDACGVKQEHDERREGHGGDDYACGAEFEADGQTVHKGTIGEQIHVHPHEFR